ncbi:CG17564 [Drosophila busckii]|uniref:CG17564 n=1 Tax=Drosophila busckii TaxID=30019 RepID=A0A0M3QT19_DROBS|nr:CG17564 [Drosophila busckii]
MPRIKPTKRIDVLGNLDLRPEEAVGDYVESRQQQKFFVKPPAADSAGDSIELMFIHNTREHDSMLKLQQDMLENSKRQSEINASRVTRMYKAQEKLRERFIEVNSFIKDCAEKKRLAEKAINVERALHEELSEDIEKFKTSISELTTFREALKATVEELQPYEQVLEDVVKISDIFVSPKDCMDRCDALMLAQVEISELENQKLQEIEQMRQQMVKFTNEAALTVLGLKNDLAKLERSYNESRALVHKWERILKTAKQTIAAHFMEKECNLNAVDALYRLLCKRRNMTPGLRRDDIEQQLNFIKREMELLHEIAREFETETASKSTDRLPRRQSLANELLSKPPNWDSAGDSVEMLYIQNAREHEAMLLLQKQLLEDAQRQTELNQQRIAQMYRIQERLRKRFIEVNGFIKDCADKKRTAEKIIREQETLHEDLSKNIDEFRRSITVLKSFREDLKQTVREFEPYERVLDEVVNVSDIFVSPKDCIDRCDALTQVEINELENKKLQEIEEMRQRMVKITSEAALTVLGLKNDLAKLERSYNESRALGLKWEKTLSLCKDTISSNDLDKERALDGIQMLYRMLCKRRELDAPFARKEIEKSADFIKREIELLWAVLREMESNNKSDKSTPQDEGGMCQ